MAETPTELEGRDLYFVARKRGSTSVERQRVSWNVGDIIGPVDASVFAHVPDRLLASTPTKKTAEKWSEDFVAAFRKAEATRLARL